LVVTSFTALAFYILFTDGKIALVAVLAATAAPAGPPNHVAAPIIPALDIFPHIWFLDAFASLVLASTVA